MKDPFVTLSATKGSFITAKEGADLGAAPSSCHDQGSNGMPAGLALFRLSAKALSLIARLALP
jgi:hypothetical protein